MHTANNLNDSTSSMTVDRKRKRRNSGYLRVRFCSEPSQVIDTYSPFEYNRSGLFPDHNEQVNHSNIILTLSIGFMAPPSSPLPLAKKKKGDKKKPKLSIDTSNLQNGPLYFTSMTTNHQKKEPLAMTTIFDDDPDAARITMENTEINRRCLVAAV